MPMIIYILNEFNVDFINFLTQNLISNYGPLCTPTYVHLQHKVQHRTAFYTIILHVVVPFVSSSLHNDLMT